MVRVNVAWPNEDGHILNSSYSCNFYQTRFLNKELLTSLYLDKKLLTNFFLFKEEMEGSNRCCEGCHTKDVNVTLRQNDMVMCDMCWGQPMSSDYIYYKSIMNIEDTHDTDAVEENGEEKNDNVDTEKIDGEESLATLQDETESPTILECATPSHSQIMHDTRCRPTEEDGVPETSQEKPVEDEKIESTPQALIIKEDNILEHESDNLPTPSTNRQTSEHESQDGGHNTIHTEEQIATGILFADMLT